MANLYNHTRTRRRTFEYERLDQQSLKTYVAVSTNSQLNLGWTCRGKSTLQIKAKRTPDSLFIFTDDDRGYHIYFTETDLTYGKRTWYLCPACNGRCAILYHAGAFVCRRCAKPAYISQNGSKIDYLADRIRADRKALWGNDSPFINDLMESCQWWPKPKGIHWARFERDKAKIVQLENKRNEIWIIGVDKFLSKHNNLLLR